MREELRARAHVALIRARLYQALADALEAPLPDWLSRPGGDNPLRDALSEAARGLASSTCRRTLRQLTSVPPQEIALVRARHARLLVGPGQPQIMPYESWHRDHQLGGPTSQVVGQWYEAMGAEPAQGELPDHLCMELAFLAYLHREESRALERGDEDAGEAWKNQANRFLHEHPLRWVPEVGDALAHQGDPVFGPIGYLLANWLREEASVLQPATSRSGKTKVVPVLMRPALCTLCGFCVQVCAPKALYIHETKDETSLVFNAQRCTSCAECIRTCTDHLLKMKRADKCDATSKEEVLFASPRAICPGCGRPHVSEAELRAVIERLDASGSLLRSLTYCVDCKALAAF
jgi:TorA maturation chaperone TorD